MDSRILLVEDDVHILGYAKTVLERAGIVVSACQTMTQARAAFSESRLDLAVLDLGLPDGNGLDLVRELGLGGKDGVPFIVLTGRRDIQTRLESFRLGAQDYVPKPFAVEELLARVQLHLRLERTRRELSDLNYELELRHRVRQDMLDMIYHDLMLPLTSIKATLSLTRQHGLITDTDYRKLLDCAGDAAEFMLLMLNDLLDISQSDTSGLSAAPQDIALNDMRRRLEALLAGRLSRMGVRLAVEAAPEAGRFRADPNLLLRIMINLISNAVKVSRQGDDVLWRVSREGPHLRLAVADRGPGVPDQFKGRIFAKYITTAATEDDLIKSGSGIGLAFCRVAAEAMNGRIWVEDRPGGGSLFILEIPAQP